MPWIVQNICGMGNKSVLSLPDYLAHRICWSVLQLPSDLQHLVFLPMETEDLTGSPWVSS